MKYLFTSLLLIVFLSSCAVSTKVDSNYTLDAQNSKGLLIISLEKYSKNDSSLYYIEVLDAKTNKKVRKLNIGSKGSDYLNSLELPEGHYKLANICVDNYICKGSNLNEKFHITAGKALYFGRIQIYTKGGYGSARWGAKVIKGFRGDEAAEILKAYPNIKEEDLISTTSF